MKQIKLLVLLVLILNILLNNKAFSQVTVVKKGDTVQYDGVLFSKDKEIELRQMALDLDFEKKRNLKLSDLVEVSEKQIQQMNKRIELYDKRIGDLYSKQVDEESNQSWKNAAYFLSGALITGLIGYGVVQAYR
jgi:hypothetical protein